MTELDGVGSAGRHPSPWRRRAGRGGAALALAGAVAAIAVLAISNGSPGPLSSAHASVGVSGTATVQRRDLVATDTESGTLSYEDPAVVYNRRSGTITWLPKVGQLIAPGQALFRIDDQPVILMSGLTPAYRDLTPADDTGPDITELNRNLVALGFDPSGIVVDDVWQPATTAGVEVFQAALGETETGSLSLGQIVFLPGAQLVATVDGTVGSTGGGGGAATSTHPRSEPEFVDLARTGEPKSRPSGTPRYPGAKTAPARGSHPATTAPTSVPTSSRQLDALIALLQAELAELRNNHSSSPAPAAAKPSGATSSTGSSAGAGNGAAGSAIEILQTTSDHLVVTVNLPASAQAEAVVGEKVGVQTPSGATVDGVITRVSSVAQSSSSGSGGGGGGGAPTVPVTIVLSGHGVGARLDQATVSVRFVSARATGVLSVPVTALLATSGTTYAVQSAATPHRLLPVTLGLFAGGYVQISGPDLRPGLQVTDSQG